MIQLAVIAIDTDVSSQVIPPQNAVPFKFIFPATVTNTSFTIEENVQGEWVTSNFLGAPLTVAVVTGAETLSPDAAYGLQNPIRLKGSGNEAAARTIKVQFRQL